MKQEEALRAMADGKAIGSDGLPAELSELGLAEDEDGVCG